MTGPLPARPLPAMPDTPADEVSSDTGLIGLAMMARLHGKIADPAQLAHQFRPDGQPFGCDEILLAARTLELHARVVRVPADRLAQTPLPALVIDADGQFYLLARVGQDGALIHDPRQPRAERVSLDALRTRGCERLILFASQASVLSRFGRFDFSWFVPAIVKYRRMLLETLLVSAALQCFALITPLFFQVVMDKVLPHNGLSTLDVVAVAFLVVVVFESVLGALRDYVFAHTASRIDVELGAVLFRHLLKLPLSYFLARRVGDSVARVRELENIRTFLTGNAITLILDLVFSLLFVAVMLFYSFWLTLVVLVSLPCYVMLSLLLTPVLRARLDDNFRRGAENQAFLVESVSAISTVKSMAIEPQLTRHWDRQLAAYVKSGFRAGVIGTLAHAGVGLIGKLVTVATLWLGARLVLEQQMTVGQLVAFNMLASHVAQPVMRLARLWTDFQQVGISMQRLGDILNTPAEAAGNKTSLPRLGGGICFEQVCFRYVPDGQDVLNDVTLTIAPGEVIGIVGRSGSGKSTLTRLVQRLYVPSRGRVRVDGMDLALAEASSLRRQIGVVLQENILFNRSIRENIALADPGASLEAVMAASRLAGAHDFIATLPEAYDTLVSEQGASLSGGQRQRIAIARALMSRPRILILDEATSALDYESERTIQQNMRAICQGRTVIIIAHRLSAVRDAQRIVVMDGGAIVEQGTHATLLAIPDGAYARLHRMQQGGA